MLFLLYLPIYIYILLLAPLDLHLALDPGRCSKSCRITAPTAGKAWGPNLTLLLLQIPWHWKCHQKGYKTKGPSACLSQTLYMSNTFKQLLLNADSLDVAPLRCVDDSYGLAHVPVWCCHKCYIFTMNFDKCALACYVAFKIRAPTKGF